MPYSGIRDFLTASLAAIKALPAKTASAIALAAAVLAIGAFALATLHTPADGDVAAAVVDVPSAVVTPVTPPQPITRTAVASVADQEPQRSSPVPYDQASLTRKLQSELKRAGCYRGPINGAWNVQTRRGMKAFTERVNAVLPLDRPDEILLALIDVHKDTACTEPCEDGSPARSDGSCRRDARIAATNNEEVPLGTSPTEAAYPARTPPAEPAPDPVQAATEAPAVPIQPNPVIETATESGAIPSAAQAPASKPVVAQVAPLSVAAATPAAEPDSSATQASAQPEAKPAGSVPPVGIYEKKRKRTARKSSSKTPAQIAKSFVKSVQKAFASAFGP